MIKKIFIIVLAVACVLPLFGASRHKDLIGELVCYAGKERVSIDMERNGKMEVSHKIGSTETEWKGRWSVEGDVIVFRILKQKIDKNSDFDDIEIYMNKNWNISFIYDNAKEQLIITCPDFPVSEDGESFAQQTPYEYKYDD